jgi:hypothetical protein
MRLEAVMRAGGIQEGALSCVFVSLCECCKQCSKWAGTVLNVGINNYFIIFFEYFYGLSSGT